MLLHFVVILCPLVVVLSMIRPRGLEAPSSSLSNLIIYVRAAHVDSLLRRVTSCGIKSVYCT